MKEYLKTEKEIWESKQRGWLFNWIVQSVNTKKEPRGNMNKKKT
jgi:hypothetical protein